MPRFLITQVLILAAAKNKVSLTDQVYENIKWKILSMEFAPGAYLNELELCSQLGYTRAPVHHALQRLKYDGLVDIIPRKGVVVKALTPKDIENLIEARLPLEVAMVACAAERATEEQCQALQEILQQAYALIENNDQQGLIRLDRDFHTSLAQMTGNDFFVDLVGNLHQRSTLLWHFSVSDKQTYVAVQKQHEAIADAVCRRDQAAAVAAITQHLKYFSKH
ncbi:GntR family transcriptional regulator [Aliamphritea hakodatensis]|uniref:GntR family transcriptional regulator n=1 Tax=Aliamphritea hakodatensis TaxID=2895352 RepID=UPI0022FD43BC|nr:GntR family transcriptional regulator [Aliamphritea hakodatensis]